MTNTEATRSGNLIQDHLLLFDKDMLVLFDSRATNSFVSNVCVERLGLVIRDLGCELIVSTPASGSVSTHSVCWMLYCSGRSQVQGESYLLVVGRTGCNLRNGLVVYQPCRDLL